MSVEDLLRLKRGERPDPDFWIRFDRDLRAKQLSALVAKRPWWQRMAFPWLVVRRPLLALGGAVAALLVAFVSLRRRDAVPRIPQELSAGFEADAPAQFSARPTPAEASRLDSEVVQVSTPQPAMVVEQPPMAIEAVRVEEQVPLPQAGSPTFVRETDSPFARSVAANLAAAQTLEGVSLGRTGLSAGEPRGAVRTVAAVEPLSQMAAPADVRRARYRSALASAAFAEMAVRTDERMARSLSDERMSDSIRRFNAKGDRLSLKF